jgi:hypothetical protein
MTTKLGALKTLEIRDVWADEARDFTPWLLNNADELSKALGLDLELHANEHPVGRFSLDLLGVLAGTQERVIIENQLTPSDHSHLGQLLTYAGGTQAKYVVWIAPNFRDEHLAAVKWLNDGTTEDIHFFAVEVSAVKIGDSLPAPLFKVVAQPNEWSKEYRASATAVITGERGQMQIEFYTKFLEEVGKKHPEWTSSRRGLPQNWLTLPAGLSGVSFCVSFTGTLVKSEIIFGDRDEELNAQRFGYLKSHSEAIESAFGDKLVWHLPEGNKQAIVRFIKEGDFLKTDTWENEIEWMLESQERLRKALAPYLKSIKAKAF